jgi:hypothetical protein
MPNPEETAPEESFSFVDKRRTVETPEPISPSNDNAAPSPSETGTIEDSEPDLDTQTSIYEIAAYCMGLMTTEGFQRMGLIADPKTGKAIVDLPSARVAIDCVAALVNVLDEPSSTLPEPVRREMKRTLNDLRLNYVDRTR